MSEASWTVAEVSQMYDDISPTADMFSNGSEHLGYWYDEDDDLSVEEAARRLTRKIVDTLGLRRGQHLLDAGCGVGAPAVQIAGEYGVRVTGVTISPVGASMATARANESDVADQVRFEVGDYHALAFPENHFDAAIAVESLLHAVDLEKVLLELHRVLRPGGAVAIAEMTKMSPQAKVPMHGSREPMTVEGWVAEFQAAGFVVEEWTQCGRRVYGQSGKHFPAHTVELREEFVAKFGEEFFEGAMEAQKGAFAPGNDHMGYVILCARKPVV